MFGTTRGTLPNIACLKLGNAKNRKFLHVHETILIGLDFQRGVEYVIKSNIQPSLKIALSRTLLESSALE